MSVYKPETILVTGGAGFIGANFISQTLEQHPEVKIVNFDALTYAGSLLRLRSVEEQYPDRYCFVKADIRDASAAAEVFQRYQPDTVVNFAAESHVDRSIDNPSLFLETNVIGVGNLLAAALAAWDGKETVRFHQVSTDEVYGSLGQQGFFSEESAYRPSSPYSASKAAADHLVKAYGTTYSLPVSVSNCSNNYGPWQFPEKLLPLIVSRALAEKEMPVYGDGLHIRDWLHVDDHSAALWDILVKGCPGESYNIGGGNEWSNIDLVTKVADILDELSPRRAGSYRDLIVFVSDRPGHDRRYAVNADKIRRELGWRPRIEFSEGLRQTLIWEIGHADWLAAEGRSYRGERLGTRAAGWKQEQPSPSQAT